MVRTWWSGINVKWSLIVASEGSDEGFADSSIVKGERWICAEGAVKEPNFRYVIVRGCLWIALKGRTAAITVCLVG